MATKTLIICDRCEREVDERGGLMRINWADARRGAKQADLCGRCADELPGAAVARRGRRRVAAAA